jgi:hypothetical protein
MEESAKKKMLNDEDNKCHICWENLNNGKVIPVCCKSKYCIQCYVKWTREKNTCPTCREEISDEKNTPSNEENDDTFTNINNGDILFSHVMEWNDQRSEELAVLGLGFLLNQIRQL